MNQERLLGVPHALILEHGAVSEPVAREMAEGARRISGADYGLSVTGIAGPDGGTREKPVGLVYVGISDLEDTFAERLDFTAWARSRDSIRERSTNRAFDLLRLRLEETLRPNETKSRRTTETLSVGSVPETPASISSCHVGAFANRLSSATNRPPTQVWTFTIRQGTPIVVDEATHCFAPTRPIRDRLAGRRTR